MLTCFNIADYFFHKAKSNLKLQKLVFYAQVWHLVFYNEPLFDEDFEAGVNGPVMPKLRKYEINSKRIKLEKGTLEYLRQVDRAYNKFSSHDLELMVCKEDPWKQARIGYKQDEHSTNIITKESMKVFYSRR